MAKTDWNDEIRNGVDALRSDEIRRCDTGDLKGLLNSIVDQLSDADRRHSDTLRQMQDRLAAMGRDANAIRNRVPDRFLPAFERIETGMAELAHRIADQSAGSGVEFPDLSAPASARATLDATPVPSFAKSDSIDSPKALRSADQTFVAAPRQPTNDDTFDIIETSLPGDVSNPWADDSADALADLYDPQPSTYSVMSGPVAASTALPSPVQGTIDSSWLEARFSDIARRIDESIADIRPDQSFFALGQRLDSVEQQVGRILDHVSIPADIDGMRVIEGHIGEIAAHLDHSSGQLSRLDGIEAQLHEISTRLIDVHSAAMNSATPMDIQPAIDIHAIARAAAEQTATRFADMIPPTNVAPLGVQPAATNDDFRDLLEGFMSDSRQGDEATNALLDTMQQAMIRLLDRVDAMEIAQQQSLQAQSSPKGFVREQDRFNVEPQRQHDYNDDGQTAALDAAVAAVASAKAMSAGPVNGGMQAPMSGVHTGAQIDDAAPSQSVAARGADKLRQDFIADARRAKMRLSAEQDASDVIVARPGTIDAAPAEASSGTAKPVQPNKTGVRGRSAPKASSQPTSAPRLMVMAVGAMSVVGGLWYVLDAGKRRTASAVPAVASGPAKAGALNGASKALTGGQLSPNAVTPDGAADSNGREPAEMRVPEGTRGEIIPGDVIVGQTSLPLSGIAVDAEVPPAPGDYERAYRRQSMAAMSSKLGQAAARLENGIPTPRSLFPAAPDSAVADRAAATPSPTRVAVSPASDGQYGGSSHEFPDGLTSALTGGSQRSAPLDMPPATVGPLSLRLAAANGDPSAEFDVGARLAEGRGSAPNYKDAAKWYQRAADRGFAQAQYRLGTLYERGLGLKADAARAQTWYERAAALGNTKAMHNLAVLSASQSNGSPDYATASKWFTDAAERGLADSQFNLAVLYENGLGVEADMAQAYKWLALAARSGDAEAVRRRDILKGKLTGENLAKAEDLVRAWKAAPSDPLTNDARTASDAWKKNPQNGVSG